MAGVRLTGSVALVTGASSGIGRSLARELAARGATVAITARREHLLEELAGEIEASGARRPGVFVADLSERGAAASLAERVAAELGPVDVLVNNAGVSVHGLQCALGDRDEAREMFETDFWSPLALVSALAPSMRARGGGAVLNVTSMIQVSPFPQLGHTCAVKAALGITTQVLRIELDGSGVNVIEAILGAIDTPGSAETRLLRGGDKWLDGSGLGDADEAARAMVRAIERGQETVIYPRKLAAVYSLPGLGRRFSRRFSRVVDADDDTVRLGGSSGDPENRAKRESWEASRR
ncbi:MAG TPA: SDR family NAD(P)-dependent oxidoreductase [Thermoleophilaceae bacterium]